jgi:GST-like protein
MASRDETLVLYGVGSPNVVKVGILLEELGVPYELRYVAVFKGEQFKPELLAMNPLGKVPVLVDPALGRPLYESGAILLYLAERFRKFLPEHGPGRDEVIQWLMVQMANIGPMFGQLAHFRNALPPGEEPYAEARFGQHSERLYRLLDERFLDHAWIAGGAYSIADMAIYPWALYLERHGFPANEYPALIRWRDAIGSRPAVVRYQARSQEAFSEKSDRDRRSASDADLDLLFGRGSSAPRKDYSRVRR